jgi:uncharacterized SAM-binding protein YcdF (DUF218 family)
MFFVLSKMLDVAVDPLWWAVTLAGAAAVLAMRARRRGSQVLAGIAVAVLLVFATPAVSNRLWASLEAGAETTWRPDVTYDAVVLLGGVVSPLGSTLEEPAWNDNIERLLAVRQLLLRGQAKVAIVSGGSLGDAGLDTEAGYLARELEDLGVPREQLIVEGKAVNTRENASLTKPLLERLGAQRVLLVTSAFHAPRALGCFRAVGLEPDMLPVDFRMRRPGDDTHVAPRADYLSQSTRALREWLGRLVYRALGYTR